MISIESINQNLERFGYMIVKAQDICDGSAEDLISRIGETFLLTDVKIDPHAKKLFQTSEAMPFHNDHPEARLIAWLCIHEGAREEPTILVDGRSAASSLPEMYIEILKDTEVLFPSIDGTDELRKRVVLSANNDIYFCPWFVSEVGEKSQSALIAFEAELTAKSEIRVSLQAGDILIIDNRRMLHRRGLLKQASKRHLRRYWLR